MTSPTPSGVPSPGSHEASALDALLTLEQWGTDRAWRGSDPYDGLNTSRWLTPLKRHRRGRQVLMQLVKRSPLDLRPLLGIRPDQDSAALAWVLTSYAVADFLPAAEQARRQDALLERLQALRTPGWSQPCWGYHYDMQSRVFFYPRTDPNAIATTYVGAALLDCYDANGDDRLLDLAEGVGEFLVTHVPQTEDPPGAFFGYLAGDRSPIHNSNLHVCALLARIAARGRRPEWRDLARRGLEWSLRRQRSDGSWPYGERDNLSWVDGFHTGYVLDSLRFCADAGLEVDGLGPASERGLAFYRRQMFLADGTPRYYSDDTYPIDLQCVAQALQTLSLASVQDPSCLDDARRVLSFAQRDMRRPDGAYVFQRRRHWVNRVAHLRGGNADMVLGLARLLAAERALMAQHGGAVSH